MGSRDLSTTGVGREDFDQRERQLADLEAPIQSDDEREAWAAQVIDEQRDALKGLVR